MNIYESRILGFSSPAPVLVDVAAGEFDSFARLLSLAARGLEEIIVMWPDRLHIIDGVTGSAQVVRAAYGVGLDPMFESDGFVG